MMTHVIAFCNYFVYDPRIAPARIFMTQRLRAIARIAIVTAVYVATGKLGLLLATLHPSASPVWPPTGIAIASLLLLGVSAWPAIFLGAFIVNISTAGTTLTSVGIATGNTLEAIVATILIQRYAGGARVFHTVKGVLRFAALAASLSTMVSASLGVATLILGGLLEARNMMPVFFTWWLGDVVGALSTTPLVLLWAQEHTRPWKNAAHALELMLLIITLGLVGATVFTNTFFNNLSIDALAYLYFIPIVWAAIRFSPREAATAIVTLSWIAIFGTLQGMGPFAEGDANTSLLLLQAFIGVTSVTGMCLAASIHERATSEDQIQTLNKALAEKVTMRTEQLAHAHARDRVNVQLFKDIINHMTIATVATDEKLRILHVNDQFRRLFSPASPSLFPGKELLAVLDAAKNAFSDPEGYLRTMRQALESSAALRHREFAMTDGTILSCDYMPIIEKGEPRGHLLLLRDVTEEKRVDRAKSEFVSLASHQLRTPLTKIRWAMGRLAKAGSLGSYGALVDIAKEASQTMSETIEAMLLISRIDGGKLDLRQDEVILADLFEELYRECREDAQQRSQTLRVLCASTLTVTTDEQLLREILRSLLRNAMKYTPAGGTIILRAFQGPGLTIEVEDNGIGIPKHEQQRVFQKFFRGENALEVDQSGTGLGLYLAHSMAGLLHAHLTFRSEAQRGTTFTLRFVAAGLAHARALRDQKVTRQN